MAGRDIHLVDAILDAFSPSRRVPDSWQEVDLVQFADSEAAPIPRRTVRTERLVARSTELIHENMRLTGLRSENDGTEEPQVTLIPSADTVPL
jgi:hypothetical protein